MTNYIVRFKENTVCFYYLNNAICYKMYKSDFWSKEYIVVNNYFGKFNIVVGENIEIYCSIYEDGVIKYISSDLEKWLKEKISLKTFDTIIHPLRDNLIYNTDDSIYINIEDGQNKILIDEYIKNLNFEFEIQEVTKEHMLIFYQSKTYKQEFFKDSKNKKNNSFTKDISFVKEDTHKNIGYREISRSGFSEFKPIYSGYNQILDSCFLTTNSSIHSIYVVKTLFSYQLIYKEKITNNFEPPILIWEGQKIENCLINIIMGDIYIFFRYKNQIFVSKKISNTFEKPSVYKNKICMFPKRGLYLSDEKMDLKNFFVRNLYIDMYNPWDIQILPDMYSNFYHRANNNIKFIENIVQYEDAHKIEVEPPEEVVNLENKMLEYNVNNQDIPNQMSNQIISENTEEPPHWSFSFDSFSNLNNRNNRVVENFEIKKSQTDNVLDSSIKQAEIFKEKEEMYFRKIKQLNQRILEMEDIINILQKELENAKNKN
ncbi:MAG: hypothetical protein FWF57_05410 [Defluviitaleaceae bacterium]|nr:hypothetical protein [Defluviitaleaceae bacterium]